MAAKLTEDIQSSAREYPESHHIGSCCADSDVPKLLESPQPEKHLPKVWESEHSPVQTDIPVEIASHDDDAAIPVIHTESSKSSIDLVQESSDPGALVFKAPLTGVSLEVLQGQPSSGDPNASVQALRLFELRETYLYRWTRRLVFLPSVESSLSEGLDFWIPLADIAIVRKGARILISWSDCNHEQPHEPVDGRTLHSRVYKRMEPNNTLLIHFTTEDDASAFSTKISKPCDMALWLRDPAIALCWYATEGAWDFVDGSDSAKESNDTARKLSRPPKVPHTVQSFDFPAIDSRTKVRGLLVNGYNDAAMSTSRVYWLPPAIDIKLAQDYPNGPEVPKPSVKLTCLLAANYKSNVQKVSFSEKDKTGVCAAVELSRCQVSWCFENSHGTPQICTFNRVKALITP